MVTLSKDIKLLTLSLILRIMPKEQQSLLMSHFTPEVVRRLQEIEQESGGDVEKLDWTPFYQVWPELQRIVTDCKKEAEGKKVIQFAEQQRPFLREYVLVKLGKQKKGAPIFLTPEVTKVVDRVITEIDKY